MNAWARAALASRHESGLCTIVFKMSAAARLLEPRSGSTSVNQSAMPRSSALLSEGDRRMWIEASVYSADNSDLAMPSDG
jgi:hypothetical protein